MWINLNMCHLQRAVFASLRQPSDRTSKKADWHRRRDIIRALVQQVETGPKVMKIVFRITQDTGRAGLDPIVVTLSRV